MRRVSLAFFAFAVAFHAQASPVAAAERRYATQRDTSTKVEGIDGYVRQSGMNMASCDNFLATWIGATLYRLDGSVRGWVQSGQTQGTLLDNCWASDVRMYAEYQGCQYDIFNLGKPPKPNYPVYVTSNNAAYIDPCTGRYENWQWAFRVGSWSNWPVAHGYTWDPEGHPDSNLELYSANGVWENIGNNYFGVNDSLQASASHGLHLLSKDVRQWEIWNGISAPGTATSETGLFHDQLAWYWSWRGRD